MPVPSWESMELALLKKIESSGGSLEVQKAIWELPLYFPELTNDELSVRLDSGDIRWANRVRWARQSLVQKGEMDRTTYGVWKITDRGRRRLGEEWPRWEPKYVEEAPEAPRIVTNVNIRAPH